MTHQDLLRRITGTLGVLCGKPVIRNTRLSIDYIPGLLAHGASTEEILNEYPGLEKAHLQTCLLFAYPLDWNDQYNNAYLQ